MRVVFLPAGPVVREMATKERFLAPEALYMHYTLTSCKTKIDI